MTTYYGLYGQKVQYLASDPTDVQTGQVWYNSTSATLKVRAATSTAAWSSGGNLPSAREGMGGAGTQTAALGNGGDGPPAINATLLYNGSTWTASPGNMNTARSYCATTGTQTAAITANGNPNPAANAYSTNSETWSGTAWTTTASTNLPSGIRAISGVSTAALVSGGYSNSGAQYNQTAVESWSGSAWTSVTGLTTGRTTGQGGVGTQTTAMVMGGFTYPPSGYRAEVELYNGTSWTNLTSMNTGRRYGAASGSPSSALIYFGSTGPGVSATSELWNGATWTASATGATGRGSIGGLGNSGTSTAALAFGGSVPPYSNLTELYLGPGVAITKTVTVS
jgi:hypothetical protein